MDECAKDREPTESHEVERTTIMDGETELRGAVNANATPPVETDTKRETVHMGTREKWVQTMLPLHFVYRKLIEEF